MNCYKIGSYVDDCGNSNRKSCRKVLFKLEPGYIYYENCMFKTLLKIHNRQKYTINIIYHIHQNNKDQ